MKGCSRAAGVGEGHPGQGGTPDQDLHDVKTVVHKSWRQSFPSPGHREHKPKVRGAWWLCRIEKGEWEWGGTRKGRRERDWELRGADNAGQSEEGTVFQQVPHSKDLCRGSPSSLPHPHRHCGAPVYTHPVRLRPHLNNIDCRVLGSKHVESVPLPQEFPPSPNNFLFIANAQRSGKNSSCGVTDWW